ncbi:hypothetical protein M3Y99_00033100 [Aphelenchoides fujianensis]|nr:hypothetical protein M3Y99_00033100 [Aphelenchoides fujianensis]
MERTPRAKRRMSVDDANSKLLQHLQNTTTRLSKVWDSVHMDQEMREKRTEFAYDIFYNTMNEIVANEEEMAAGVHADIKKYEESVQKMLKALGMPPFQPRDLQPGSLALMLALKEKEAELTKEMDKAMARQREEYNKLVKVCQSLSEPVPQFAGVQDEIVTLAVVEKIVKQRVKFEREFEERRAEVQKLQEQARRRLHCVPNVTLTAMELELINTNFADSRLLPKSLIAELTALIEKFEAEYVKWRDAVEFEYQEVYATATVLAEKCCATERMSEFPTLFDVDSHDPELIKELRAVIADLESRYETNRKLFDSFHEWLTAFRKLATIEDVELKSERARQNRGGYMNTLLKEQKAAKRCTDNLLQVLHDLCAEQGAEATIDGQTLYGHALALMDKRSRDLEDEKTMKKLAKDRMVHMEARFGTSTATSSPSKSRTGTPRKRLITPMSAKSPKMPKLTPRPPLSASNT